MIAFGKTLREAREAKGLTIQQIAETTHIMASQLTDLENEVFTHIAAPIYGRGFVKLYCQAVGIDPKPLVEEFMEIYNGNRDLTIRERPVPAPAAPVPPPSAPVPPVSDPIPEPQPVAAPAPVPSVAEPLPVSERKAETPVPREEPLPFETTPAEPARASNLAQEPIAAEPPPASSFRLESERIAAPQQSLGALPREAPDPLAKEPIAVPKPRTPLPPLGAPKPLGRLPNVRIPSIDLPPNVWRIALVVSVVLALLLAAFFGIRYLYRTTMPKNPDTVAETKVPSADAAPSAASQAKSAAPTTNSAKPAAAKRKPIAIDPLYLD